VQLELALSLRRDGRSVLVARHVVRAAMDAIGVTEGCTHDLEVALSEACTNVIQHADPAGEYQVRLQLAEQRCLLRVTEASGGLVGEFGQQPPDTVPAGDAEHGRGLVLMRALVDRVGFRLLPGVGAVVWLEKRLTYAADSAELTGGTPPAAGR